jgi:hypothetical protein
MSPQAPPSNSNEKSGKSQIIPYNSSGKSRKLEGLMKRVKLEGEHACKSPKEDLPHVSFATSMYATIPNIGDGNPMSRNDFVKTYGLICQGFSPKEMKVPRDISLEDVSKTFGPIINKNGYNYTYPNGPMYIKKNRVSLDGHTPKALPSYIMINFLRDCKKTNC